MMQRKMINELRHTFWDCDYARETEVGNRVIMTLEKIVEGRLKDTRKVNVFSVGPRGGVKVIKQEFRPSP